MPQVQEIFHSRFKNLSTRAKYILAELSLDKFENFYNFFVVEKQKMNFSKTKNCGYKTELELINLVKTITNISIENRLENNQPYQIVEKKKELLFDREFERLKVRARNVLASFGVNDFHSFNERIVKPNDIFIITKIRNCGAKTTQEIIDFTKHVITLLAEIKDENYLTVVLTQDKKTIDRTIFTSDEEILFKRKFLGLSNRAKNILIASQADKLNHFVNNIINNIDLYDLKHLHNCGEKTENEIEVFKKEIFEILGKTKDNEVTRYLFKDIETYIFEGNILRDVENRVFCNYLGYIENQDFEDLETIAKKFNYTAERIRQIIFSIQEKIKKIVSKIIKKDTFYLKPYFLKEYFTITPKFANSINTAEHTNFSCSFISFVLQCIEESGYKFVCTQKKPKLYSGLFYKADLPFDLSNYQDFFYKNIPERRKQDIKIKLEELMSFFMIEEIHKKLPSSINKIKFSETFKLLCDCIYCETNPILLTKDYIIFKRTTKKKIYDYLVDILSHYKKPLHFSELYDECIKNGVQVSSPLSIHSLMQRNPDIFGLKGPGIYGLISWGGYFGTIGDVTEKLLRERNEPINKKELTEILIRELYISQDSINTVLFNYKPEKRFIKMRNNSIGLKEWADK